MIPMKPEHIERIKVQPKQEYYKDNVLNLALDGQLNDAYTYFEDGEPKASVGMQPHWQGRYMVWALIGKVNSWPRFHKEVHKVMKSHIKKNNVRRLEMTTEVGFIESERWAKMLGFKQESVMPCYGMDGKDHKMWVKL